MGELVSVDEVVAARELLEGVIRVTPVEPCRPLAAKLAGPAFLKCENFQRAGSFKVRGAYVRIARLSEAERARGVVAASAGNHGQGVALAAGLLGAQATVFMPVGAALPKIAATKGYGARVQFAGQSVDEALEAAIEFSERTGAVVIHPFDHPDVIAGQGTLALEIIEQVPDVRTIVASIGGGGLCAGIGVAAKALRPSIRIVGVQAAGAASYPKSIAAGRPVRLPSMSTIADGIAVGQPGEVPFEHVSKLVDEIVTVTDEDISRALLMLLERGKMVVEPAGAAAVAALLADAVKVEPPVVAVLSGGNIDPLVLLRVVQHGLVAAGRYLKLQVRLTDKPGALARLVETIAAAGANIVAVDHTRTDVSLSVSEVWVNLQLETKGAEHRAAVVERLESEGYEVGAV
jgi:threonine dehydratase